jgi:hypothetical protein
MAELDLTQSEADALIAMEKVRLDDQSYGYPNAGGKLSIGLSSRDGRERFVLDIHRGRIDLAKGTYQNRAKQIIPLVRLDFGGAPHTNPDGEVVPTPHIHTYREGFGDKWARPLPPDRFANSTDAWELLQSFYGFCSIVEPPQIERGLFT